MTSFSTQATKEGGNKNKEKRISCQQKRSRKAFHIFFLFPDKCFRREKQKSFKGRAVGPQENAIFQDAYIPNKNKKLRWKKKAKTKKIQMKKKKKKDLSTYK